jgi:hypothetical protein
MSDKSKFKVGDRIVCVNDVIVGDYLVLNKVYVVKDFFFDEDFRGEFINFVKVQGVNKFFSFERFISLKEYRRRKLKKIYERLLNEKLSIKQVRCIDK